MANYRLRLAAVAALLSVPLSAADLPEIKLGLWSVDASEGAGDTFRSNLVCMDKAVVQELMKEAARSMPPGKCQSAIDKHGSTYVEKTDCSTRRGELHIKSVATFVGNRKFHIDSERTGNTVATTLVDGKYISACPTAMEVGDVVTPNGTKINVLRGANAPAPLSGSGGE